MFLNLGQVPADAMAQQFSNARIQAALQLMDERLKDNKWLAGEEFTAAETSKFVMRRTTLKLDPLQHDLVMER